MSSYLILNAIILCTGAHRRLDYEGRVLTNGITRGLEEGGLPLLDFPLCLPLEAFVPSRECPKSSILEAKIDPHQTFNLLPVTLFLDLTACKTLKRK